MVHIIWRSDHLKTRQKKYMKSQMFGFQAFGIRMVIVFRFFLFYVKGRVNAVYKALLTLKGL